MGAFKPGKRRAFPKVVVRDTSPHQSARSTGITSAVVHDTESHNRKGASDLKAIGGVFHSREASAHRCTDADGHTAIYVADTRKAWHGGVFNSPTLGLEQIGFATFDRAKWKSKDHLLHETARNLAEWSRRHRVPLRKGKVRGSYIAKTGILTHRQLGGAGGGHWDPGYHYPMGYVLWLARGYKRAQIKQIRKRKRAKRR